MNIRNLVSSSRRVLPILLPLTIFLTVQAFSLRTSINIEEGRDALAYWQGTQHLLPYWDFEWFYGPLSFFVYPRLLDMFGTDLLVLRISYLALSATLIPLSYFLCRKLMPSFWASVASFLAAAFIQIPFYTYNHIFQVIGYLATFLFLARFWHSKTPLNVLLAGIATSLALLGKPVTPGISVVLCVVLGLTFSGEASFKTRVRSIGLYLAGACLMIALFVGSLQLEAGKKPLQFMPFFSSQSVDQVERLSRLSPLYITELFTERLKRLFFLDTQFPLKTRINLAYDALLSNLFWLIGVFVLWMIRSPNNRPKHESALIFTLVLFSFVLSFEGLATPHSMWRAYTLQPTVILLCYGLFLISQKRKWNLFFSRALGSGIAVLLPSIPLFYYPIGKARSFTADLLLPRARGIRVSLGEKAFYETLYRKWKMGNDGAPVAILGYYPNIAFLTEKRDIFEGEQYFFIKLDVFRERAVEDPKARRTWENLGLDLKNRIDRERPSYIVSVRRKYNEKYLAEYFPEDDLPKLLGQDYVPDEVFTDVDLSGAGSQLFKIVLYRRSTKMEGHSVGNRQTLKGPA